MRLRNIWAKGKKVFVFLVLFFLVERLCFKATGGFRIDKILSDLPPDERYSCLCCEMNQLDEVLKEPFTYIGQGGCVYCFASQNGKYVIKFFKHQHLCGQHPLSKVPLPSFLSKYKEQIMDRFERAKAHKRREFLFSSFLLAWQHLRDETGLIHLQLAREGPIQATITLFDKIGCKHFIDLSQTEFIIQKRASLLIPHLLMLENKQEIEKAKRIIDSFFLLVKKRCMASLGDRDSALAINFGVENDRAIEIDVGSFYLVKDKSVDLLLDNEIKKLGIELEAELLKKGAIRLSAYLSEKNQHTLL